MMDKKTQERLKELEKTASDFWNLPRVSANFLNMLIKIANAKNVLEIGTSNGYSGIWLAKALKKEAGGTGGKLTTIEFWDNRQSLAIENFKYCDVDDVITTKLGSALDILPQLQEQMNEQMNEQIHAQGEMFDFVFIDANKSEYIKYFELVDKMLKSGGIIAADNITSHAEKVKPFVDAIMNSENYQAEILDSPFGLLLAYKK